MKAIESDPPVPPSAKALLSGLSKASRRSSAFVWLYENFAEVEAAERLSAFTWAALASRMNTHGLRGKDGEELGARRLWNIWQRVRARKVKEGGRTETRSPTQRYGPGLKTVQRAPSVDEAVSVAPTKNSARGRQNEDRSFTAANNETSPYTLSDPRPGSKAATMKTMWLRSSRKWPPDDPETHDVADPRAWR